MWPRGPSLEPRLLPSQSGLCLPLGSDMAAFPQVVAVPSARPGTRTAPGTGSRRLCRRKSVLPSALQRRNSPPKGQLVLGVAPQVAWPLHTQETVSEWTCWS